MAYQRTRAKIETDINWNGHFLEGSEFQFPSSSGSSVYTLTVGHVGPVCDCPGFKFNGKCKHITGFVKGLEGEDDDRST